MPFFLEAKMPLRKTFVREGKGFVKEPYPMAAMFTSHRRDCETIEQLFEAMVAHASKAHCLIKGELIRNLTLERRVDSTNPLDPTSWLCIDLDYVKSEAEANAVLAHLGLDSVSHIKQFSASHLITKDFSAHYFFMLNAPVLPQQLKTWLKWQNFQIPQLERQISLTRPNTALRWPMDISVADNSRIIYIAPPRCEGFDDPLSERTVLVKRTAPTFALAEQLTELDVEVVQQREEAKITELRKARGLKAKKLSTKTLAGVEVVVNSGKATVTGHKESRGFMYLNLNGGDSWGYFHPVEKPDILYNFKGEPNYLTRQLLPDYYKAYKKALIKERQDEKGETVHFAFLDRTTDIYFRGTFDPSDQAHDLYPTNSVKKVEDFLKQNGQMVGDYIEEWDYLFRFDDERIYVPSERFVNRYVPTDIMKAAAQTKPPTSFPLGIAKVLRSVTGGDKVTMRHFMNWLAVIIQHRQRTQTAWIFNGVQGTGKGVLIHEILKPILGPRYVQVKSLADLDDKYNEYMQECILLMVDESKRTQIRDQEKVMARLKQCITDPVVPVRAMRTDHYLAKNYMNVIVTSNFPDPLTLEQSDRRFNVGDYQPEKLFLTDGDIKQIRSELPDFASILLHLKADKNQAKTPLQNQARKNLMFLTQTSLEVVFGAITTGNLQFFIDDLPTDDTLSVDPMATMKRDAYINVLREAQASFDHKEPHRLTRDQVWTLADYTLGDVAKTPNKFSSLAKHYGIRFERMRKGDKSAQCIDITWKEPEVRVEHALGESRLRAVK